jgi:S1-C subfamily serine protease
VPSNLVRKVVGDLMQYGEVRRGSVGYLRVDKLTDQLAQEVGSPTTNGAVVSRMMRDSESYEAGLRPGDVIVEFNRQAVDDPSQFFRLVADAKVGSTAAIRVLREGRAMDFKLPIVSSAQSSARVRR